MKLFLFSALFSALAACGTVPYVEYQHTSSARDGEYNNNSETHSDVAYIGTRRNYGRVYWNAALGWQLTGSEWEGRDPFFRGSVGFELLPR